MRTTLNLDDDLLRQASELTGITETTALLRESKRIASRAGSYKDWESISCTFLTSHLLIFSNN
ncbi:MAG: type II toxin-antitoxin system VapB family antitoxin [Candidatus Thiothrix sulfatifontis]|nr:MAG: type II toxin-antitoxin system VapB family antitoxin [Candidatus Thiothrix sulfatifontis]